MPWNDTDVPLAILVTFRTYGTWLHGDKRGSVDRHNNIYGTPRILPSRPWEKFNEWRLKREPVILDAKQRASVEKAIISTCAIRSWTLHALNVRTNHAHCVIYAVETAASRVLIAVKANATRQMREDGCWTSEESPWAEKGSKRLLWNERSVGRAVDYVLFGQGDDLPKFD
jgi:REP element-mobilizing transposase RayT